MGKGSRPEEQHLQRSVGLRVRGHTKRREQLGMIRMYVAVFSRGLGKQTVASVRRALLVFRVFFILANERFTMVLWTLEARKFL